MNAALPLEENAGWKAQLQLEFKTIRSKTVLGACNHIGPLRVQRPFYPENNLAHTYILHPPGGVVGGDQLTIEINVKHSAQALCTTPGSGKFYLSAGNRAKLDQHLRVDGGGSLEWLPQENILFAGARLHTRTKIEVRDNAKFIGWEITCLGRPSSDEIFNHGAFDSQLAFYHNEKLILLETQRIVNQKMLTAAAGLRGEAMQATLLAFPCNDSHLENARNKLLELGATKLAAITLFDGLLVMRALESNNEKLKHQLISVWQTLRPMLLDREAIAPRIWAT
jgi:urease accessory protein